MHGLSRNGSAAPDAGWRTEVSTWCHDFRRFLGGPWREQQAGELFERIEAFSVVSDLIADSAVSDATAELAVYLCAFADSHLHPDKGQVGRLHLLVDDLEKSLSLPAPAAVPETAQALGVAPFAAGATLFRVLYLREPTEQDDRLVMALERERMEVLVADSIDAAIVAIDNALPDAVVLHADFVGDLQLLTQPGRRHGAATWRRVLLAATGMGEDVRLRLHARRAGVDVLLEDDPDAAGDTLLHAMLRRREEAYRVMVVEDDRGHAAFCESLLRHQGFEVDIAQSAEHALMIVESRTPDLVLLDINLPDMSGIELAQLLRERHSLAHVPLVFLTGEEDLDRRAEAIAAGGDDFLSKPIRPRHLLANVNSRIGRARALALSAPAERQEDGLAQRLDRVRFVEALERLRSENSGCAGVAVYVLDDVARVADGLGFVRAGNLALQIAQAIEAECGGIGRTCGIGEFSRLALVQDSAEAALRARVESLRWRLTERSWGSTTEPLRVSFSAGLVRFDGSLADRDAVIADAIAMADGARRDGGGRLRFHDLR
jgi:DNA-binding response OmpR family regulator